MKTNIALKVRFDDRLARQMQDVVRRKLRRSNDQDNLPKVTSQISASGASLKITIMGEQVLSDEFGTLRRPARPWISNLIRQAAPLLRQALAARFKPTR